MATLNFNFNFNADFGKMLSLSDSLKLAFSKLTDISGRARRSEFAWLYLSGIVIGAVLSCIPIVNVIAGILLFLATLTCSVRRLHDTGYSGWWYLLVLIPVVDIALWVVLFFADSQPDTNNWGKNPKE